MLDWMFMLFVLIAVIFIILSLVTSADESYWKILFVALSTVIWFILALSNLNIETPYPAYNSTSGLTTMEYSPYIDAGSTYMTYFFGLMGVLCVIYLVVLMFGLYYERMDERENE